MDRTDAPPPPMTGGTVRALLVTYTLVLVTPVLLFAAFLFWRVASTERDQLETDAAATSRAIAASLDRDLAGLFASLDVLSLSPSLQVDDYRAFHDQAAELARRQGIVPVVARLDGQQVVNLRLPFGAPLPRTALPIDRAALEAGRPFVTDLFNGVVAQAPVYAVATGVMRNGRPAYVVNFSLDTARLQRILTESDIAPGYTVAIIDRAGHIMARSARAEDFVGRLATRELIENTGGQQGTWSGPTLDGGAPIFGAYTRSRLSDFRVAVAILRADLNAPVRRSATLFAALGLVIAALSFVLSLVFGRRITGPIRMLAEHAARLGRGEVVGALSTGLLEANQVGAELAASSRARAAREAELSDANEEVQRFAYIVSHDLRSPLVNIMGFTTELEALRADLFARLDALSGAVDAATRLNDRRMGEDFDEAIGFIKASIGKMDRLINAILRLSREGRREFRPERIDMDAMLTEIAASLKHQADAAGAAVVVSRLPSLTSDRVAMEQIFSNLVDNALKYLRAGVEGRVEVTGRTTPEGLVYEVRDNGRGIDPRDAERVFELFRRSGMQDRPGEGIGLAHVRALVRRLGGQIGLTSTPGQGSTFTVTLPRRWVGEAQRKAA